MMRCFYCTVLYFLMLRDERKIVLQSRLTLTVSFSDFDFHHVHVKLFKEGVPHDNQF